MTLYLLLGRLVVFKRTKISIPTSYRIQMSDDQENVCTYSDIFSSVP